MALTGGAVVGNVSITNPIKNPGSGTINFSPNAAGIVLNGANSKVKISGN